MGAESHVQVTVNDHIIIRPRCLGLDCRVDWVSHDGGGGEAAKPGGLFDRVSDLVLRRPWHVIACWIVLAAALALLFPPLPVQAGKHPQKALPDDAPTMVLARDMDRAFSQPGASASSGPSGPSGPSGASAPSGASGSSAPAGKAAASSLLMIILTDDKGISPSDVETYGKIVDALHADTQDNLSVQDFISAPPMRDVLESKDGKAINLPITIPLDAANPATIPTYHNVKGIVKKATADSTLTANVTGPVATVADATEVGFEDAHFIEIGTIASVFIILFAIYRNVVTMLVPLATIGVSIVTSQFVLSGLADLGLPVNMQTIVLMSAVMIGAGVDYAVFLISRYHDYVKRGAESDQAVKAAMMSIGKVIAASAATVAVTFSAMVFTELEVFSSVGPAVSLSVIVSFLAAITFLPAILVLVGRRGWVKPRGDMTSRFWRVMGIRTVRKPRIHLIASLIVLISLASCATMVRFNYDDLKTLPEDVDSSKGYKAMDRHFPQNMMTPEGLIVQSSHDLRTPTALADLEQMARRVAELPNIVMVRGLTRPNGDPLEQTKMSFQAGEVGNKLDEASSQIHNHGGDLDKLVNGSNQLADALAQIRTQVTSAVDSLAGVAAALTTLEQLMGGDTTIAGLEQASAYTGRMKALGDSLTSSTSNAQSTAQWAAPMASSLNSSPSCSADPSCVSSRSSLNALVTAENDGTLPAIRSFARTLQATQGAQNLSQTLGKLQQSLEQAATAMKTIKNLQQTMSQLKQGSGALADGSRAIAWGVKQLVDSTKQLGGGLNDASSFLLGMKHDANQPNMAGFNIPPQVMGKDEFKKAAQIFISPDGHAARYLVQSALNPFTTPAMDQVAAIVKAAKSALTGTELTDAKVALAGLPSGLADTRDYYNNDINFIIFATILIVFVILVVLLRAVVAPLYLIVSVLVSYLSALGIGVVVFQGIFGDGLHWSLPGLSFILLVAVGADYNMLLISRIRDESPHGVRVGVIRTVGSTGGVITSAGLIFAASMFGLLTASISTMVQAGFVIGTGILIDTFLVRTITVPALAAMIGQKNWWPSQLGKSNAEITATQESRQRQLDRLSGRLTRMKVIPNQPILAAASPLPATDVAVLDREPAPTDYLSGHALPLFDLGGLADRFTDDLRKLSRPSPAASNGKKSTDRYLGHSLPLFGFDFRSHRPTKLKVGTVNGNHHSKANRHPEGPAQDRPNGASPVSAEQPADHYASSLPLFGPNAVSRESNGSPDNGEGHADAEHQEDDADLGHSLPLFGPKA